MANRTDLPFTAKTVYEAQWAKRTSGGVFGAQIPKPEDQPSLVNRPRNWVPALWRKAGCSYQLFFVAEIDWFLKRGEFTPKKGGVIIEPVLSNKGT